MFERDNIEKNYYVIIKITNVIADKNNVYLYELRNKFKKKPLKLHLTIFAIYLNGISIYLSK